MLDKPISFVVLNLFSFVVVLLLGGFLAAFPLSVLISLFIIAYNYKKIGIKGALVLAIIYLLAFDCEIFYFSKLNIRVWYFYLIIIYIISFFEIIKKVKITLNRMFIYEYIVCFVLFIWSIYFLIIEDFISKINNVKYWVFYLGLILVLNNFFTKNIDKFKSILDYIISITVFIMFWGILQFPTNLLFLSNFQLDYFNLRPSAFFSETTWYSEFIFFGLILIILKILTVPKMLKLLYLTPFYFLGFLFSITRNTFLALFIYLFFTFLLTLYFEKKIFLKIISSKFIKILIVSLILIFVFYIPQLAELASFFTLKFSGQDDSAQGRLDAFYISIHNILNGNVFGNGYYWDSSQATEVGGSALGSKSFNLIFMMGSIFGIFGGVLFITLLISYIFKLLFYYYKTKSIYIKYSFIVFIIFLQMAMFAPIHQFPFGMLIVSLSVFLFKKGLFNYEKNNICNLTV